MSKNKKTVRKDSFTIEESFNIEISSSERLRSLLLIALLGLEAVLLIVIYLFYREQYNGLFNSPISLYAILIFTLLIIVYESFVHYFIGKGIPLYFQRKSVFGYLNTFSEITLLTVLFIFIIEYSGQTVILQTPATLTYFLFIVLSTLRLNFKLSIFTGGLAAVEYIGVSVYYSTVFSDVPVDRFHPDLTGMQYLGQGMMLLISGIAAGYVADLIKQKMLVSWKSIQEKNEVIDLFGQQISPQIAERILENKDELSGTRKNVCVMFLDIRNFTPFVENHSPEEVVAYLNKLFYFMIDIVQKYDGVINQFLGDGFMATFGAPVSGGNISQKAVMASMEIIQKVKQENQSGDIPPTRIGIGLHYGEAVIGNIGSASRKQYSITGDVVILAARIEQLNKIYQSQLIISDQIFRKLSGEIKAVFTVQEPVNIKGINQPFSPYILDEMDKNIKNNKNEN